MIKQALLVNHGPQSNITSAYFDKGSPLVLNETLILYLYQAVDKPRTPVKEMREYVQDTIIPELLKAGVLTVIIADAEYFKVFTKQKKAEPTLGCVVKVEHEGVQFECFYIPNYKALFRDPDTVGGKIQFVLSAYASLNKGTYVEPGKDIIKHHWFPEGPEEIAKALDKLKNLDKPIACDIETYSLRHTDAGVASISFSWDTEGGIAFLVDYSNNHKNNKPIRDLLKSFFIENNNKIVYHRITYDVYVMIYQLFMNGVVDQEGLIEGMEAMLKNWDCTYLISYLALNSCARPNLSLKDLAQVFAGNWAIESDQIKDVSTVEPVKLLTYNLIDTMSTMYVYETYLPIMIADEQQDVYETIFKPAAEDIIQMQLTGMPIDMGAVIEARKQLEEIKDKCFDEFNNNPVVNEFNKILAQRWVEDRNSKLKTKRVTIEDANVSFNPNSNQQLQTILYEILDFPVLETTTTNAPATGGKVIKKLKELAEGQAKAEYIISFLDALSEYKAIDKILSSFIPALENATLAEDGWHYLFGFFNLGGTVSGRLSSNSPNLQNLPANGPLAKIIKKCFKAPPGWLFVGLDYASLEDRISALTTKDPNKLKVYMGHLVYEVTLSDGSKFKFRDDSNITYKGITYKGEDFYAKFNSDSLLSG